ncbi:MAG: type II secretion system GspH family protein [Candidatus Omnitrophica bacterium]|nr:type II secretion system GspH family protein [Candidatus Omnitrophota bacterium]MBU4479699.1 type II secretion system GspH family protein [Candidatus Omnitrophota bacterium]MCG2703511.1 type II secretion system GspH family protein [Candidatus Omnitrophota bacterium]
MRKISGFTLIELMIAVLVIGILVTMAVPNYARSVERAKCSQAIHNLKTMRNAALDCYAEDQTFADNADTIAELAARVGANFSDNTDWTYQVTVATDAAWTVRATRVGGHWNGLLIFFNQDEAWTGSTYPFTDPGGW